ncbi:MAG: alanine racemase, partial [Caldilineaceae bacterium]
MTPLPARPPWGEVDQTALTNNVRQLRRRLAPGARLMAVVKANAYGHGCVESARTFVRAGADSLAVATLSEAIELRLGGIEAPILVLGYTPPWQAADAVHNGVTLTVFDLETAVAYATSVATD